MEQLICPWESPTYLFFSSNVPSLIYYSHATAIIAALSIGVFILASNPKGTLQRLFFLLAIFFSIWVVLDVALWATNRPDVVMFFWSLQVLLEPLTYATAFYLYYFFLHQQWPGFKINVLVALLLTPLVVFLPTHVNLEALTLSACEAVEGPLAKYYTYIAHAILMVGIVFMAARRIPRFVTRKERLIALWFGLGLIIFLLAFSSGNIISSFTDDWVISQYGLFGMPIFVGLIAYSIVKFQAFNIKLIATQALVAGIAVLIGARLFYSTTTTGTILSAVTLIAFLISGVFLVRSVKREIAQREHIEVLAKELAATNERQETLIHFIGHEVKGFLTKDAGAFAALSDGDFGELPEALKPFVEHALTESRNGARSVTDLLTASNQKKGTMSYTKEPFDLKQLAAEAVEKAKPGAEQKGLALSFTTDESSYQMTGDKAQIGDHVLRNIIENSINYTPSGSVTVSLKKENGKLVFAVRDTGVGITEEDKKRLFTEGGHGKDSQKVNAHSTGYGLYIAKNIVLAHGGAIRAESEGAGKGSTFIVELPA